MTFPRSAKIITLLVASQAACLAMGVWIHGRFVTASAHWHDEQQTNVKLVQHARRIAAELPTGWRAQPDDLLARQLGGPPADTADARAFSAVLVDDEWRVIAASGHAKIQRAAPTGTTIQWRSAPGPQRLPDGAMLGQIMTPIGPRAAAVLPIPKDSGHIIACKHGPEFRVPPVVLKSFPGAGLLTFVWVAAVQGIIAFMVFSRMTVEHARKQTKTDEETLRRNKDLIRTRDAVIFGLAKLAESRDPETGQHLERISLYSTRLASALRRHPKYRQAVTPGFVRLIGISAALHDIGKVGIKDDILLKQGPLTAAERAEMETHSIIGAKCLETIEKRLGPSNFLDMAREIALSHHECWDGSGYPHGAAGEDIPLAARIVAIADVYDALSCERVYKDAMSHDECVSIIRHLAGRQFDPELVRVFLEIEDEFRAIARRHGSGRPSNIVAVTEFEPGPAVAEAPAVSAAG